MDNPADSCIRRTLRPKSASVTIYLMEELGDARIRCDQLLRYLDEGIKLIEKSTHRDHFFEVAGHLIQGVPETAFKLQKALQAVALAADRLDYEEIKQDLRPEKVQQLENVLKDVRLRHVQRRSEPMTMTPKQVSAKLKEIAAQTRESGTLPQGEVLTLIQALEQGSKQASTVDAPADVLERLASSIESAKEAPSRHGLAKDLRNLVANDHVTTHLAMAEVDPVLLSMIESLRGLVIYALRNASHGRWRIALVTLGDLIESIGSIAATLGSTEAPQKAAMLRRDLRQTAMSIKPGQPVQTEVLASEDKTAGPMNGARFERLLRHIEDTAKDMKAQVDRLGGVETAIQRGAAMTLLQQTNEIATSLRVLERGLGGKTASEDEEKHSRFEEGKPADPTENMDADDAAKWEQMTDKHKDNFKSAKSYATREALAGDLMKVADELFTSRVDPRRMADALKDAEEEFITGMGPFKGMDSEFVNKKVAGLRNTIRGLDNEIGSAARQMENVARDLKRAPKQASDEKSADEDKSAKFEEGKPADPTQNMDAEDAKKWKTMTDKHEDKFKSASVDPWKAPSSK